LILSKGVYAYDTTEHAGDFTILYRQQRYRSNHRLLLRKLGFETRFQEPDRNPFFAIIGRDGAQLLVKSDKDVLPWPNPSVIPR